MYAFRASMQYVSRESRTFGGSGNRFGGWVNLYLVPNMDLRPRDRSARQLQNPPQLHAPRGQSKRRQAAPQLDDLQVPIKTNHVDLERHSKSMDAGRGVDAQLRSPRQTRP